MRYPCPSCDLKSDPERADVTITDRRGRIWCLSCAEIALGNTHPRKSAHCASAADDNDDPDCTTCGHAQSFHVRGPCGASTINKKNNAAGCRCRGFTCDDASAGTAGAAHSGAPGTSTPIAATASPASSTSAPAETAGGDPANASPTSASKACTSSATQHAPSSGADRASPPKRCGRAHACLGCEDCKAAPDSSSPGVDAVVTAICVMIRDCAAKHRDPSDPYQTSGTYAAASYAEELADDIANGEWRKHLKGGA